MTETARGALPPLPPSFYAKQCLPVSLQFSPANLNIFWRFSRIKLEKRRISKYNRGKIRKHNLNRRKIKKGQNQTRSIGGREKKFQTGFSLFLFLAFPPFSSSCPIEVRNVFFFFAPLWRLSIPAGRTVLVLLRCRSVRKNFSDSHRHSGKKVPTKARSREGGGGEAPWVAKANDFPLFSPSRRERERDGPFSFQRRHFTGDNKNSFVVREKKGGGQNGLRWRRRERGKRHQMAFWKGRKEGRKEANERSVDRKEPNNRTAKERKGEGRERPQAKCLLSSSPLLSPPSKVFFFCRSVPSSVRPMPQLLPLFGKLPQKTLLFPLPFPKRSRSFQYKSMRQREGGKQQQQLQVYSQKFPPTSPSPPALFSTSSSFCQQTQRAI